MKNLSFNQLIFIWPEIIIILTALFFQLGSLFIKRKIIFKIMIVILIIILLSLIISAFSPSSLEGLHFFDTFFSNKIIVSFKGVILFFTIIVLIFYYDFNIRSSLGVRIEFITLVLFSTVGAFFAISSKNLLLLFPAIELQSIVNYIIASFKDETFKSSEGAVKYFILGVLISSISFLGLSFIYGFTQSFYYADIVLAINDLNVGVIIGITLFLISILFKLSLVPLHTWTPDVYEGCSISAIVYFVSIPKFSSLIVLYNIFNEFRMIDYNIFINLIRIIAILSMILGVYGALKQISIKRLLGYSTILNLGYVLIVFVIPNSNAFFISFIYMLIYALSIVGILSCMILVKGNKSNYFTFQDFNGLGMVNKFLAFSLSILVFSLIGIPPLPGFFIKYFLFYQAILEREYFLGIIGIISSIIASFYYLKIIKSIYFCQLGSEFLTQDAVFPLLRILNLFILTAILLSPIVIAFTDFNY